MTPNTTQFANAHHSEFLFPLNQDSGPDGHNFLRRQLHGSFRPATIGAPLFRPRRFASRDAAGFFHARSAL